MKGGGGELNGGLSKEKWGHWISADLRPPCGLINKKKLYFPNGTSWDVIFYIALLLSFLSVSAISVLPLSSIQFLLVDSFSHLYFTATV